MPQYDRIGRNYITLTWTPPLNDGGSKVTGYIVERRDPGTSNWIKCNDYNVKDPEFTVPNLVEFKEYEFRVIAVNNSGKGEPSEPCKPVKIQEAGGKLNSDEIKSSG